MGRGTTRKAVSVQGATHARLDAYQDEEGKADDTKSGFLEDVLARKHPEVFGDEAPQPAPRTKEEITQTTARQQVARARFDEKKDRTERFFPGMAKADTKKTTPKKQEPEPRPEKDGPKRPPPHLQPKPEPKKKESEDTDPDDIPTGIVFF